MSTEYTYVDFGGMQNAQANFTSALKSYQAALDTLDSQVRAHLAECLVSIPWDGLKLSAGDPAIPVTMISN